MAAEPDAPALKLRGFLLIEGERDSYSSWRNTILVDNQNLPRERNLCDDLLQQIEQSQELCRQGQTGPHDSGLFDAFDLWLFVAFRSHERFAGGRLSPYPGTPSRQCGPVSG